jgi:hypothetical protein
MATKRKEDLVEFEMRWAAKILDGQAASNHSTSLC